MDSDSDDDLLPNVNKLNEMFNRVQREARQETAKLLPSKTSKNAEKKSSKEKVSSVKKSTKRSTSEEDSAKKVPKKDLQTVNVSEESRKLLEEMDMLTSDTGITFEPLPSSTQAAPPSRTRNTVPAKQKKTTSKRSGRRGKKPVPEPEVHIVHDSDDSLQRLDATFDDSEEIVVEPVLNELYSLRVRWKNDVLRFKVPEDSKISQIRMDLGERVSMRADDLVILDDENNTEIPDNTPVTEIPFEKTLEAFEREKSIALGKGNGNIKAKDIDPDCVIIKLQGCGGYRERYTVVIKRTTHVKQLIDDYVEKFQHHGKTFKLQFDGDDIDSTETPESLDLENGDMIDVREV